MSGTQSPTWSPIIMSMTYIIPIMPSKLDLVSKISNDLYIIVIIRQKKQ